MKILLLVASFCIVGSGSAATQLAGHFYLQKATFARGEPVFLYFSLVNKGPDTAVVVTGDSDQPLCSGISITVSSDPSAGFSCPSSSRDNACVYNGPIRTQKLPPGQTYIARFLLNFHHDISATGDYWIDAKYNSVSDATEEGHARLEFHIAAESITSSEWKPWLEQLHSPELEERREAARTLASLAPLDLEETLLGFANSPELRQYAPLAFHRFNTRRSIEALAQFMKGPVTNEQIEAARYLAETNNQECTHCYVTLLKNARISAYPTYAAELGGEKMLPLLVALEKSPDTKFTHLNAVMAMGSTGSRAAIPILLDQLKSPDIDTSDHASYGLQLLTHRTAIQDSESRNRQAEYIKWSRWWEREGPTAPIYKDSDCGQAIPLP